MYTLPPRTSKLLPLSSFSRSPSISIPPFLTRSLSLTKSTQHVIASKRLIIISTVCYMLKKIEGRKNFEDRYFVELLEDFEGLEGADKFT